MQTPENTPTDTRLRCVDHMARASDFAYALVQELAHLTHELAPMTGGPLEPVDAADKAYAHALNAAMAAHRITRDLSAVAVAFDADDWTDSWGPADGTPALELVGKAF